MRYPSEDFVLREQARLIDESGGLHGLRDRPLFLSAINQPFASFGGVDLYPGIIAKAAALGFFLVRNHPFLDGNKRIGHEMMEWTLVANQFELIANLDEQEKIILALAAGTVDIETFTGWVVAHTSRMSF